MSHFPGNSQTLFSNRFNPGAARTLQICSVRTGAAVWCIILLWAGSLLGADPIARKNDQSARGHPEGKSSMVEARPAYLWGFNEIWFRDGDNPNIRPGKREITLNSPALGLQGEKFLMRDLALRAGGWFNLPQTWRNDSVLGEGPSLAWDTRARYLCADLSVAYHLGLGGTPYRAGLAAGYRYNDFLYRSERADEPAGVSEDHMQVHVPYLGVHYAHNDFKGSILRLDFLWSVLTLSRYESERRLEGEPLKINGHALTGLWLESVFAWSFPLTDNFLLGAFAKYNFMELSGGATIRGGGSSTRFSMDSRHHLIHTGLAATYTF